MRSSLLRALMACCWLIACSEDMRGRTPVPGAAEELDASEAMEDTSIPRVPPPRTVTDCCGCLCADPSWSCAMDTCTVDGVLEDLWSEAGFFEIEPGVLFSDDSMLRARMWYSFWPADTDREKKPLLVIFQGGPDGSMAILWGGNTGPFTLDPGAHRRAGHRAEPTQLDTPRLSALVSAAVEPDVLVTLTGVDVESIAWLHPSARVGATRDGMRANLPVDTSKLIARLGSLVGDDTYFVGISICVFGRECSEGWLREGTDAAFADILRHVEVFMTDARADSLDRRGPLVVRSFVSSVSLAGRTTFFRHSVFVVATEYG